jgi:hypothetical protein
MTTPLPVHTATRYAVPLREGGSLPAVIDTEDAGLFVTKFRGAGQGARALVAEIIAGQLALALGLPLPRLALIHLDEAFGRTEPDSEIQDILKGSRGLNVGLGYLDGAFSYDPVATADLVSPDLAADIVWFDALITNIDRTPRNPNLLIWQRELWLIDHGAALYFHHDWASSNEERARTPFVPVQNHVLLPVAASIEEADERLAPRLEGGVIDAAISSIPDELLMYAPEGQEPPFASADENRQAYRSYIATRLAAPRAFAAEAERARTAASPPRSPLSYRR